MSSTSGNNPAEDAPGRQSLPNALGWFGEYGGRFVPETLIPACFELEAGFRAAWSDPVFRDELATILREWELDPADFTGRGEATREALQQALVDGETLPRNEYLMLRAVNRQFVDGDLEGLVGQHVTQRQPHGRFVQAVDQGVEMVMIIQVFLYQRMGR